MNQRCLGTCVLALLLLGACSGADRTADTGRAAPDHPAKPAASPEAGATAASSGVEGPAPDAEAPATPVNGAAAAAPTDTEQGEPPGPQLSHREVIYRALEKPVEVDFEETPLKDVAAHFEEMLDVEVVVDRRALDGVGIGADSPITFRLSGVSARTTLELILRALDLTWIVRDEVLLITTRLEVDRYVDTRIYDVRDLIRGGIEPVIPGGTETDFDSLLEVVTSCIEETTWDEVGGPGSISPIEAAGIRAIAVSQMPRVHEQVERLLADLRRVRATNGKGESGEASPASSGAAGAQADAVAAAQAEILRALARPVTLDFVDTPLGDVMVHVAKLVDVPAVVDQRALEDVGLADDEPVTIKVSGVSLESALNLALRPHDLDWALYRDVLLITTAEEAEYMLSPKVYDVSDLVRYRGGRRQPVPDYGALIDTITSCIVPGGWGSVGGVGEIAPCEAEGVQVLVVAQTAQAHREIAELLARMRAARDDEMAARDRANLPPPPLPSYWGLPGRFGVSTAIIPYHAESARTAALVIDATRQSVAEAANRFALDLYAKVREKSEGNLVLSPLSLYAGLSMVYAGTAGETTHEMADVLHVPFARPQYHAAFRALLVAASESSRNTSCRMSYHLWGQRGQQFSGEFLSTTRYNYGSDLFEVDFADAKAARKLINAWVSQETGEEIREILRPGMPSPEARLALTSGAYFQGRWARPFDADSTWPAPFEAPDGQIKTPTMYTQGEFAYGYGQVGVLVMPYALSDLSMVILLPPKGSEALKGLEEDLTLERLKAWMPQGDKTKLDVYLPRFRCEAGFELSDVLRSMGLKRALSSEPGVADFSGMRAGGEPLWLDTVVHRALVEVEEEGPEPPVEARPEIGFGREPWTEALDFRVDRPFLFFIRDDRTGVILLMGRVVEPPQVVTPDPAHAGEGLF